MGIQLTGLPAPIALDLLRLCILIFQKRIKNGYNYLIISAHINKMKSQGFVESHKEKTTWRWDLKAHQLPKEHKVSHFASHNKTFTVKSECGTITIQLIVSPKICSSTLNTRNERNCDIIHGTNIDQLKGWRGKGWMLQRKFFLYQNKVLWLR